MNYEEITKAIEGDEAALKAFADTAIAQQAARDEVQERQADALEAIAVSLYEITDHLATLAHKAA